MLNITKLKCWPELRALGFEVIRYWAHGRISSVGASLRQKLKDTSGKEFYVDVITIEPTRFSDGKSYHISGIIKSPFTEKLYRYEYGRKVEFFDIKRRVNEFYKAKDIINIVNMMLK